MARGSRRRFGGRRTSDRGQATVELALALPVVVLFALVVVQAGLVAKDSLVVAHAAREGARAAAVEPTLGAARTGVERGSGLDPARTSVALSGATDRGGHLTVTVTYRAPTHVPLVGSLVPDVELTSSVTIRVE